MKIHYKLITFGAALIGVSTMLIAAETEPAKKPKSTKKDPLASIDPEARKYWAYTLPKKVDLPADSSKNPIDIILEKELNKQSIPINQQAKPKQLLRRLSYDLTGLPPNPEQLASFGADKVTGIQWKETVNQYLSSRHFGEKMATSWLDLVRYAETNGFERDSVKPEIWRYRDYVIASYNRDVPYNRFIIEQLAGDEIENPTYLSNVATGFLALMQRDDEPADYHQAHADMISDMVDVTGEAFLAATMNCAKCHDHKGDPIRQSDYYSMRAFFEPIGNTNLKSADGYWKKPEVIEQQKTLITKKEKERSDHIANISLMPIVPDMQELMKPKPALIKLSDNKNRQIWSHVNGIPGNQTWNLPSFDGNGMYGTQLPLHMGPKAGKYKGIEANPWHKPWTTISFRRDFNLTTIPKSLIIYTKGEFYTMRIFINGVEVYNGKPIKTKDHHIYALNGQERAALTTGKNTLGFIVNTKDQDLRHFNAGLYTHTIDHVDHALFASVFPELLLPHYGIEKVNILKSLNEQIRRARIQIDLGGVPIMKHRELPNIAPSFIHKRGIVHVRGVNVPVTVPAAFVPTDEAAHIPIKGDYNKTGTHGRRLALANWIASDKNPLTARVMMNRLWQHCFGAGIVASPNDFGVFGQMPSNQELLDWLAVEFMESGWSVKHMLRVIMTSEAYRRSSGPNEKAALIDPLNKHIWRNSPRRFTGEEIRDTFLTLTKSIYLEKPKKPFVRPKIPEAVLATSSQPKKVWPMNSGVEANARSIYVHVKRSMQLPILSAFDAPARDMSCPERFATTVPTQALTMFNSEFVNDSAAQFAVMLEQEAPNNLEQQLSRGFRLATGRPIADEELKELQLLHQDLINKHQKSPAQAMQRICLLFLNLNETIYLD